MNKKLTAQDAPKIGAIIVVLLALTGYGVVRWRGAQHQAEKKAFITQMTREMGMPVIEAVGDEKTTAQEEEDQKEAASAQVHAPGVR